MTIRAYCGKEEEFHLGNFTAFNRFQEEVSRLGNYPNLLQRTFLEGKVEHTDSEQVKLLTSSVIGMLMECKALEDKPLSPDSKWILEQLTRMLNYAVKSGNDIEFRQ